VQLVKILMRIGHWSDLEQANRTNSISFRSVDLTCTPDCGSPKQFPFKRQMNLNQSHVVLKSGSNDFTHPLLNANSEQLVDPTMLTVSLDGTNAERGVRESYTPSFVQDAEDIERSPHISALSPSLSKDPTTPPQRQDDLPPASDSSSDPSVLSDSLDDGVLSDEFDRMLKVSSAESLERLYTKEDEQNLRKRRGSIPCEI